MSNVVPLPSSLPPDAGDPHPRAMLRRPGRWLAWSLTALLGLVAAFAVAVLTLGLACGGAFLWLAPGAAYIGLAPSQMPGLVPFAALPWPTRWAYAATFVLGIVPILAVLCELRSLARAYATGIVFDANIPKCLRRIGLWLVADAVAPAIGQGLVRLAGHGVDLDWFHASSVQALVLAAVALVLAPVMRIGHVLQVERDGFV